MPDGSNQKVLDEIIDNAAGLPLEGQNTVLLVAKAMQYVRGSMAKHSAGYSVGRAAEHPRR